MKHIVHLTIVHPATDNRISGKQCQAVLQAGHRVTLVAPWESGRDKPADLAFLCPIPSTPSRFLRTIRGYRDSWRRLRMLHPDILHVHDPELIPFALVWKLLTRNPAVYDAHEDLPLQIKKAKTYIPRIAKRPLMILGRTLEVLADRSLSAVVVATPRLAKNYSNRNVVIVQNFPWMHSFGAPSDYPSGGNRFAYVGRISMERGARAMVQAVCANSDALLRLAGTVADRHAEVAIESGGGRVEHVGVIAPSDISALLDDCVAGFALLSPLPNYLEAQSTKIYEYMAAGRPFIASDFPAWVAQLGSYNAGFFVDPADSQAVAACVQDILANPGAAAAMGRRGRQAMVERFCFDNEAPKLLALYSFLSEISETHGTESKDVSSQA